MDTLLQTLLVTEDTLSCESSINSYDRRRFLSLQLNNEEQIKHLLSFLINMWKIMKYRYVNRFFAMSVVTQDTHRICVTGRENHPCLFTSCDVIKPCEPWLFTVVFALISWLYLFESVNINKDTSIFNFDSDHLFARDQFETNRRFGHTLDSHVVCVRTPFWNAAITWHRLIRTEGLRKSLDSG